MTLFVVGLWQILVVGFIAFLLAVLYQHLRERNELGRSVESANAITPEEAVLS